MSHSREQPDSSSHVSHWMPQRDGGFVRARLGRGEGRIDRQHETGPTLRTSKRIDARMPTLRTKRSRDVGIAL
jgi:hypothetical protein